MKTTAALENEEASQVQSCDALFGLVGCAANYDTRPLSEVISRLELQP